jgi:hypothetical protein
MRWPYLRQLPRVRTSFAVAWEIQSNFHGLRIAASPYEGRDDAVTTDCQNGTAIGTMKTRKQRPCLRTSGSRCRTIDAAGDPRPKSRLSLSD